MSTKAGEISAPKGAKAASAKEGLKRAASPSAEELNAPSGGQQSKSERDLQLEREDAWVAELPDTMEAVNKLRAMGRMTDAVKMEARITSALAEE